jgi:hypothetical protein
MKQLVLYIYKLTFKTIAPNELFKFNVLFRVHGHVDVDVNVNIHGHVSVKTYISM